MNETLEIRRKTDLAKLSELQSKIPRVLEIVKVVGDPPKDIQLRIHIPTAKNLNYPRDKQEVSEVIIQLSESYPFPPGPLVNFITPIWNPNVFASGKWCFGEWKITENLQLFVIRLMRVIALDPSLINPRSPANGEAARWYVHLRERHPEFFPTMQLPVLTSELKKPKIMWRNIK